MLGSAASLRTLREQVKMLGHGNLRAWFSFLALLALLGAVVSFPHMKARLQQRREFELRLPERLASLEPISVDAFLSFLDQKTGPFSYRRYGEEIVVAHSVPEGEPVLYRLKIGDDEADEVERQLAERIRKMIDDRTEPSTAPEE